MIEQHYTALDSWIDAHFREQVAFLKALVRVPTDTPPGDNAPHAQRTAELLSEFGFDAEKHPVPAPAGQGPGTQVDHQPHCPAQVRRGADHCAERPW